MRHPILIAAAAVTVMACSRGPKADFPSVVPQETAAAKPSTASSPTPGSSDPRKVGDFWVHRISGSFSQHPLLLTERVTKKGDTDITVEYTLEELESVTRLLVRHSLLSDRVLGVARVVDGKEEPGIIDDYENLMAKTTFLPDSNEGYVERSQGTCLVGPSELDCETKSYRVRIGDREATLDVTQSDKYPGRDIGGEISSAEGEVIYRAELLEAGHDGAGDSSVAAR